MFSKAFPQKVIENQGLFGKAPLSSSWQIYTVYPFFKIKMYSLLPEVLITKHIVFMFGQTLQVRERSHVYSEWPWPSHCNKTDLN